MLLLSHGLLPELALVTETLRMRATNTNKSLLNIVLTFQKKAHSFRLHFAEILTFCINLVLILSVFATLKVLATWKFSSLLRSVIEKTGLVL